MKIGIYTEKLARELSEIWKKLPDKSIYRLAKVSGLNATTLGKWYQKHKYFRDLLDNKRDISLTKRIRDNRNEYIEDLINSSKDREVEEVIEEYIYNTKEVMTKEGDTVLVPIIDPITQEQSKVKTKEKRRRYYLPGNDKSRELLFKLYIDTEEREKVYPNTVISNTVNNAYISITPDQYLELTTKRVEDIKELELLE